MLTKIHQSLKSKTQASMSWVNKTGYTQHLGTLVFVDLFVIILFRFFMSLYVSQYTDLAETDMQLLTLTHVLGQLPHRSTSEPTFGFQVLAVSQRVKHLRGPCHARIICPPDLQTSVRFNQAPLWPMPLESSFSLQTLQGWRASMKRTEVPFMMSPCSTAVPLPLQIPLLTLLLWGAPKPLQHHITQWQPMCQQPEMSLAMVEAMGMVTNCPSEDVYLQMKL